MCLCKSKVKSINSQGKIREIRKIDLIIRLTVSKFENLLEKKEQ